MKFLITLCIFSISMMAHAKECTTTLDGLKKLVGNDNVSLDWFEDTNSNPLTLKLSEQENLIFFKLTNADGIWAEVLGKFCKVGENEYIARTSRFTWGPEAPRLAKMKTIKEISIDLPQKDRLTVSVAFLSFDFKPIE